MTEYRENNSNTTENYGEYHYNVNTTSPNRRTRRAEKRNGRAAKFAKRVGAVALSAVLFGGIAAGTYQAVNYAAGAPARTVNAASDGGSKVSLLRTTAENAADVSAEGSSSAGSLDVSGVAEAVMPSIVSITNKSVQEVQNYYSMFGYGYQPQTLEKESRGSGIIIGKNDDELLIVTNYHVIADNTTLSVSFIDNQVYEAKVKGTDPDNDLAVIAVPLSSISSDTMSEIAVAAIGDSDSMKVGQQVVAIGNALGYGQSVTTGIVSAMNRSLNSGSETGYANTSSGSDESPTYIQTDAAINPGNSGGALVNMKGEVIGINSAKLASTEVEGMGYAIPMSRAGDIIEELMNETTRSKVETENQASIGITGVTVSSAINQTYGIPEGVFVSEVTEGGAAEAAGIKSGDVITKFDGKKVTDINELKERMQYYSAGESVEVTLKMQENHEYVEKTVTVTLGHAQNSDADTEESQSDTSLQDYLN